MATLQMPRTATITRIPVEDTYQRDLERAIEDVPNPTLHPNPNSNLSIGKQALYAFAAEQALYACAEQFLYAFAAAALHTGNIRQGNGSDGASKEGRA